MSRRVAWDGPDRSGWARGIFLGVLSFRWRAILRFRGLRQLSWCLVDILECLSVFLPSNFAQFANCPSPTRFLNSARIPFPSADSILLPFPVFPRLDSESLEITLVPRPLSKCLVVACLFHPRSSSIQHSTESQLFVALPRPSSPRTLYGTSLGRWIR